MSKMNIMETIVLDLMDTPEGVKILEFQDLGHSAIGKYYQIYGENLSLKILNYYHPDGEMAYQVHHDLLRHICDNKNAMGSFVTPYAVQLFPKQKVYAYGDGQYSIKSILDDFPNTQAFAFKEPEKFSGDGVFIISREELENLKWHENVAKFFQQKKQNAPRSAHFLVQEAMTPKLIEFPNKPNQCGLPAIRIVMTVCPRPNDEIEFVFHGGYYKFPAKSLLNIDAEMKISSKTQFQIKTDCVNGSAAKIDEDDYKNICNQIEDGLSPFFRALMEQGHERMVVERLLSDNLGDRVSAAMFFREMAGESKPYDVMTNSIQALINDDPCLKDLFDNPLRWSSGNHCYIP